MTRKQEQAIILAFCTYDNAVSRLHLGQKQREQLEVLAKKFHRTFRRAINNQNKKTERAEKLALLDSLIRGQTSNH